MPSAPGVSSSEEAKIRRAEKEKKDSAARKREEQKREYQKKANPETVEELLDGPEVEREWFKEGEWKPEWAIVEFVSGLIMIMRRCMLDITT